MEIEIAQLEDLFVVTIDGKEIQNVADFKITSSAHCGTELDLKIVTKDSIKEFAWLTKTEKSQEEDMFQHIRISGYDGVYSAIDIDAADNGKTYAIFKSDNGGTINLLCEVRDFDSLRYIANTSCSTVSDTFK